MHNLSLLATSCNQPLVPGAATKVKRYTVHKAQMDTVNGDKTVYLVLDDGIPFGPANRHLVLNQTRQFRPQNGEAYILADYLNFLDNIGVGALDATRGAVYDYVHDVFCEGKAINTVDQTISTIARLYESLYQQGITLDPTLLAGTPHGIISSNKQIKRIVNLGLMRKQFVARSEDIQRYQTPEYLKWYTGDEVKAILDDLSLTYRCIFATSLLTGFRVGSTLSVLMSTLNLSNQTIRPTTSKTRQLHTAYVPPYLVNIIATYLAEIRAPIVMRTQSTSEHLFLNGKGEPITYAAYYAALKQCEKSLKVSRPDLAITSLHTHACRSTFLALLRSYQLECKRKGVPTITDEELCLMMDWRSMSCLHNYDILTRAQDASPLYKKIIGEHSDLFGSGTNEICLANKPAGGFCKETLAK